MANIHERYSKSFEDGQSVLITTDPKYFYTDDDPNCSQQIVVYGVITSSSDLVMQLCADDVTPHLDLEEHPELENIITADEFISFLESGEFSFLQIMSFLGYAPEDLQD